MKNYGYVTIEAAVLISVIILILSFFINLVLNEFITLNNFCNEMESRVVEFNKNNPGEVLRMIKALFETGGDILNGLF